MSRTPVYRLIIAGSRTFDNDTLLAKHVTGFLEREWRRLVVEQKIEELRFEIIVGRCPPRDEEPYERGADFIGELYAYKYNFPIRPHPAKWKIHGRAAGPIRNREMAEDAIQADYYGCIVFHDGKSPGAQSMIDIAREDKYKHKLTLEIIRF